MLHSVSPRRRGDASRTPCQSMSFYFHLTAKYLVRWNVFPSSTPGIGPMVGIHFLLNCLRTWNVCAQQCPSIPLISLPSRVPYVLINQYNSHMSQFLMVRLFERLLL